jgi:uncharacterized protein YndB with AHSA1/START domain
MTYPDFVQKEIMIDASIQNVWKTITTPELIRQWMSDEKTIVPSSDWKVGSKISFTGVLHRMKFEDKGEILEFEPNKKLKYSYWSKISRLPNLPENYSIIEFILKPNDKSTILTVRQSNLKTEVIYKHINFYWNSAQDFIKKVAEEI